MAREISEERIYAILSDARAHMFAGAVDDREALDEAVERGLVERFYEGAGGLMGLAKLRPIANSGDEVSPPSTEQTKPLAKASGEEK